MGGSAQSGKTVSTFSFVSGSSGSYLITVTVTDSLGVTSVQSFVASVNVSASPTVSVAPVGPVTLDVGQVQVFTATPIGVRGLCLISGTWMVPRLAVIVQVILILLRGFAFGYL